MTDGLLRVTKYSLRSLWPLGLGVIGLLVLPPLGIRLLNHFLGRFNPPSAASLGVHFFFMAVSVIMLAVVSGVVLDQTKNLLSRIPVATAEIVSGLILYSLIITVVVSLVSVVVYRQFLFGEARFHERWSVLGPTLFLSTMVVVMHCAFWNLKAIGVFSLLFWSYFCIGAIGWFMARYSPGDSGRYFVPWKQVTLVELLTMSVVFVTAWFGAIRSCALVRCGAAVPALTWERLKNELGDLKCPALITNRKQPASISTAFTRLYWRDSARLAAMLIIGIGCVVFVTVLFFDSSTRPEAIFLSLYAFIGSGLSLLIILDNSLGGRNSEQMKGYLAIVPLSDRDISLVLMRTLLKLILLSIASVLLFGLAGGTLVSLLLEGTAAIRETWSRLFGPESNANLFYTIGLILLADWAFIANVVSLIWAPQRRFNELMVSIPTIGIGAIGTVIVSGVWPTVGDILFLSISTLILSVTIIAYVHAYKTGLIRIGALWLAGLFCVVTPTVYWNFWSTSELPLKLLWSSLLILAVTPFASMPLAVKWNRHR